MRTLIRTCLLAALVLAATRAGAFYDVQMPPGRGPPGRS